MAFKGAGGLGVREREEERQCVLLLAVALSAALLACRSIELADVVELLVGHESAVFQVSVDHTRVSRLDEKRPRDDWSHARDACLSRGDLREPLYGCHQQSTSPPRSSSRGRCRRLRLQTMWSGRLPRCSHFS